MRKGECVSMCVCVCVGGGGEEVRGGGLEGGNTEGDTERGGGD